MSGLQAGAGRAEDSVVVAAVQAGGEAAFGGLAERYRPELRVHCYRMLGSLEESEDLVQETFLRAWRRRETFQGRSTFRAWLYRIATNACLDFLDKRPRRPQPAVVAPAADPDGSVPPVAIPWLQPYPDQLLEGVTSSDAEPAAAVIARETLELAFLAALQLLPPRQRAVLVLRDVLGWSAKETASLLEVSVAAVNSSLQRARPALRRRLPQRRLEWAPSADPTAEERVVLQRFMDAIGRADDAAIAELLAEDARCGQQPGAGGHMAPEPAWYSGRDLLVAAWAPVLHGPDAAEFRFVLTSANRQPAAAQYIRPRGSDAGFQAFALTVVRIEDGAVAELSVFAPDLFQAFGLPRTL